jgi:hypothetical protein
MSAPRTDGTYQVVRHSGRNGAAWRTVYKGDDWARAGDLYEGIKKSLRQGAVRLLCEGEITRSCGAPRLRSRW